jgi:hypothetical protein
MAVLSEERSIVLDGRVGQFITTSPVTVDPLTDEITFTMDKWSSGGRVEISLVAVVDGQEHRATGRCSAGAGDYKLAFQIPVMFGEKAREYIRTAPRNPDGTVDGVPLTRLGETAKETLEAFVEFRLLEGTVSTTLRSAVTTESPAPTIDRHKNSVAFNAQSSAQEFGGDGVLSVSHTAAGTGRAVFAGSSTGGDGGFGTATSITYGGVAMTELWDLGINAGGGGLQDIGCAGYQLAGDGNIGTSAATVTSTRSTGAGDHVITVMSMTGVDSATPVGTPQTASSNTFTADDSTVTVADVGADDLVVDRLSMGAQNPTIGADQTQRTAVTGAGWSGRNRVSTQPGTAGGVMSWTFTDRIFVYGAVAFKAAVAAGGATSGRAVSALFIMGMG